ncbi:MAG: hypothetical protein PWK00_11515 [Coxiella burnetii]|nr:hypothetical protein [Coxiella burnetii]
MIGDLNKKPRTISPGLNKERLRPDGRDEKLTFASQRNKVLLN